MIPRRTLSFLCLLTFGCGVEDRLAGSLSETLDLSYQSAELELSEEALSLRFVRNKQCEAGLVCRSNLCVPELCSGDACTGTVACAGDADAVFELTADVSDLVIAPNTEINLAERTARGVQRGVASRNVQGDPRKELPELEVGRMRLYEDPSQSPGVRGNFSLTFIQGIDYANGRTVFSNFTASVL